MEPPITNKKKCDDDDDGGRLIFCKTCRRGYHPTCLTPPLESIPNEDWECSNCLGYDDLVEPIKNLRRKKGEKTSNCCFCSKTVKKLKMSEEKTLGSKSTNFDSVDKPLTESNKSEAGNKRVDAVSDSGIHGNMKQDASNRNNVDYPLVISDAGMDSVVNIVNHQNKDSSKKQLDQIISEEVERRKEKCAEVCASPKENVALKNKSKEPLSSPITAIPKQSFVSLMQQIQQAAESKKDSHSQEATQEKTIPYSSASSSKNHGDLSFSSTFKKPCGLMKYKPKLEEWCEKELNYLWVGVRRHGQGNWEAILADSTLHFQENKTPQALAARWETEIQKIFPTAVATLPPVNINNIMLPTTKLPGTGKTPPASWYKQLPMATQYLDPYFHTSGLSTQIRSPFGISINNSNCKFPHFNNIKPSSLDSRSSLQGTTANTAAAPGPAPADEVIIVEKVRKIVTEIVENQRKARDRQRAKRKESCSYKKLDSQKSPLQKTTAADNDEMTTEEIDQVVSKTVKKYMRSFNDIKQAVEGRGNSSSSSSSINDRKHPMLLLGGKFQIPGNFMTQKKSTGGAADHDSAGKGKEVVVIEDSEESSENTMSE